MNLAKGRLFQKKSIQFLVLIFFLFVVEFLQPQEKLNTGKSDLFIKFLSSEFKTSGLHGLAYGSCEKLYPCKAGGLGVYNLSTGESFEPRSLVPLGNFSSILTRLTILKLIDTKKLSRDDLLERKIKFLSDLETGIRVDDLLVGGLGDSYDDLLFSLPGTSLNEWSKLDLSFLKNIKESAGVSHTERNLLWEDILLANIIEETTNVSYKEAIQKIFSPPLPINFFKLPKSSGKNKLICYEYFFGFPTQHKNLPDNSLLWPALFSYGSLKDLMSLHTLMSLNGKHTDDSINFTDLGFNEYQEFRNKYYVYSGVGQGGNFSILVDLNSQTSYYILTNIFSNNILYDILKKYIYKMNGINNRDIIYSNDKLLSLISILEILLSIILILFLGIKIGANNFSSYQNSHHRTEALLQISLLFFLFLVSYYFFIIYPKLDYIKLQSNIYSYYGHIYKSDFKIGSILLISVLVINSIYYYLKNY